MTAIRTLVIAETLPYPVMDGKDLRNWQNVNGLRDVGEVGVFGLMPNSHGGHKPIPAGLAFWMESDFRQTKEELASRAWLLDRNGHPSDMYYSNAVAAKLEGIMTDFKPNVVVVERLSLHRYIGVLRRYRGSRIILDSHNIEASVTEEIAKSTFGEDLPTRIIRDILPKRTSILEQTVLESVDQLWVCSAEDARLMKEMYQTSKQIHVVPNTVDVDYYEGVRAARLSSGVSFNSNTKNIIFPASFRWEPNERAATFLMEEIFPRLVMLYPDCRIFLVGGMPTSRMMALAENDSRVVVTGRVTDVRPYLVDASVMIVPLFQGSGTRFKILEAFASKIPVISTAKGREGLDVIDGTHLLTAESAEEFVSAVRRVWADEWLVGHLTANGFDLVMRLYSWETASLCISEAIGSLKSGG